MNTSIMIRVARIFNQVLEVDEAKVNLNTTIDNLDEWDSMKHLELVMEIEKEFNIEFQTHEVILLNTVERLVSKINEKLKV